MTDDLDRLLELCQTRPLPDAVSFAAVEDQLRARAADGDQMAMLAACGVMLLRRWMTSPSPELLDVAFKLIRSAAVSDE
jgi:hypothetical protein